MLSQSMDWRVCFIMPRREGLDAPRSRSSVRIEKSLEQEGGIGM